ncbi:hypothetical protein BJ684DRAFT_14450 [Piptocephalis cylindrospora]|uniref:Uncharacterized protein n=1 Tax=Piptocephalis cylindrospora TaxID=1907219 RepID=A0A4P9Y8A4_9FUNG|nr:hypothetical protein BJ684DRAFT_14450 [Piptocephalis cylindrospora]|eukprot:RKP15303.1 hypothetical protein BJ684DRAFT_14450 [Piptocephalis cylindrospora]
MDWSSRGDGPMVVQEMDSTGSKEDGQSNKSDRKEEHHKGKTQCGDPQDDETWDGAWEGESKELHIHHAQTCQVQEEAGGREDVDVKEDAHCKVQRTGCFHDEGSESERVMSKGQMSEEARWKGGRREQNLYGVLGRGREAWSNLRGNPEGEEWK